MNLCRILILLSIIFPANSFSQTAANDTIIPLNPTFLGNSERNFYGRNCPDNLHFNWKLYLGEGITVISRNIGEKKWKGAGWTGQPLIFKEDNDTFLIQGAYDHNLKKINAKNGTVIWEYKFDDVIKGTGSYFYNTNGRTHEEKHIILQGSRLGVGNYLDSEHIPSYRAISFITGKELWRLDVKWTDSYSRDADGSALIYDNLAYIGLENSLFTIINPDPAKANIIDGMLQPLILEETCLYNMEDVYAHGSPKVSNIVTESSPSLLGKKIYISSGSGHLFGYDIDSHKIEYDFYIGSDIDGSPVITSDSCILQSIEKQYIKGNGGVYKLNPALPIDSCVKWYFPVGNRNYAGWEGGIIGSVAINDNYIIDGQQKLAAFVAIDGYTYVVNQNETVKDSLVLGSDSLTYYQIPKLVFKYKTGASISTPLFFDNLLLVATYDGLFLFKYDDELNFSLISTFPGEFESTPAVYDRRIYIASRNGYLYCLGK